MSRATSLIGGRTSDKPSALFDLATEIAMTHMFDSLGFQIARPMDPGSLLRRLFSRRDRSRVLF